MISDDEYRRWLLSGADRAVWILEMDYPGGTEYLQRGSYSSPGARVWRDLVSEIRWSDRIDGQTPIDSISLINTGDLDAWLDRDWLGCEVRLYIGDRRWPPEAFRRRATLINGGVRSASNSALEFAIYNPLAALDVPVQPLVEGRRLPVCFGSPFNVSPPLIDSNLGYQLHPQAVSIDAVRDKGGATAGFVVGDPVGGFRLTQQPVGGITCDPVASSGTPAELVAALCDGTGIVPSAASLASLPDWSLGIWCNNGETKRAVLDQLLGALWAAPVMNADNELEIRLLQPPSATPDWVLTRSRISSVQLQGIEAARGDVVVNYARNWTVQDGNALLAEGPGITPESRQLYGDGWQSVSQQLSSNALAASVAVDTPFIDEAAALAVLADTAALRSQQRYRARVLVLPELAQAMYPGDTVKLHWHRYGLQGGRCARVLEVSYSGEIAVLW